MRFRASLVLVLAAVTALTAQRAAVALAQVSVPTADGAVAPLGRAPAPDSASATEAGTKAKPREPRARMLLRVRGAVRLHDRPGGRVRTEVGTSTEFGSARVFSVVARRKGWLGVVSEQLPNGSVGWVRRGDDALRVARTLYSLHADVSRRRLELRRGGRAVLTVRVAVGTSASPTPPGRYAVTDKLRGSAYGPYYGCCILALTGHQPKPPPGWTGGTRLAIHGTDSPGTIGTAASAGCLRASDRDMERLMTRVPLGTPVFVRG